MIEVHARPVPQPRPRAVRRGPGISVYSNNKQVAAWRAAVKTSAAKKAGDLKISGPVKLQVEYRLPKLTNRRDDIDNLLKSTMDALSNIWEDDSLVVDVLARKKQAETPDDVGARIIVAW